MAGDAHYSSVSLLLAGDGADGSSTLTDSGPSARSPASVGTALISTDQSKWGGSSVELTGSGDQVNYANNAAFNFGSGAFTVELWVRPTSVAAAQVLCTNYGSSGTGWSIAIAAGGDLGINLSGDGYDITASGALSANTWAHVAISGSSGSIKAFIDGTQAGSTFTGAVSLDSSMPLTVGALLFSGTWYDRLTGFVDDLRITKGVARYTGNFTPPAAAFDDRSPQVSGNIKDSSGANAARTVRAYRRDTGALVGSTTSNGTTGNYTIDCSTDTEVTVVALDNATSGTYYNDQAVRVIPA